MENIDLNEKKQLILANETAVSRQLARYVIDKPLPQIWMIFIPIFFAFYFSKLKQYESDLHDFSEHHLLLRCRVLDAVLNTEESRQPVAIDLLVNKIVDLDERTRPLCVKWLTVLAEHFRLLLAAQGQRYPDLVRYGYRSKRKYKAYLHQLSQDETAFNWSLLPTISGNNSELSQITKKMAEGIKYLQNEEVEAIFSCDYTNKPSSIRAKGSQPINIVAP